MPEVKQETHNLNLNTIKKMNNKTRYLDLDLNSRKKKCGPKCYLKNFHLDKYLIIAIPHNEYLPLLGINRMHCKNTLLQFDHCMQIYIFFLKRRPKYLLCIYHPEWAKILTYNAHISSSVLRGIKNWFWPCWQL